MNGKAASYDFLPAPVNVPRGSVTGHVASLLRNAIVSMELGPGTIIDKNEICARLNVSRFPVSEALARLQTEGLVDILPQRGTRVSFIRIQDVREYMLIRKALEAEAAYALALRRPAGLAEALAVAMRDQKRAADADDRQAFHMHDCAFHDRLFEAMNLERLKTIIASVRANVDRARRLSVSPRRYRLTLEDHQAISLAIMSGDADAAANAMRRHIDQVLGEVIACAEHSPWLFADGDGLDSVENHRPALTDKMGII